MTDQYFPAVLVGEFVSAPAALEFVGMEAYKAAVLGCDAHESYDEGAAYAVDLSDLKGEEENAMLVLVPLAGKRTRLCVGYPTLFGETASDAISNATRTIVPRVEAKTRETPEVYAYRLNSIQRTMP